MKQIIYVDVLFALNTLISFFLLAAARRLCSERTAVWRMILGSFLGGAASLTIFLPQSNLLLSFLLRAALLLPVVFTVFGFGSARRFVRLWLATAGVSCLFAGALMAAWFLFRPSGLMLRNGAVYLEIGFLPLVLGCGALYTVVWLFRRVLFRRKHEQAACVVRFDYGGRSFTCRGMIDTGNTLRDPFTGQAVQVISESLAERVIPAYDPSHSGRLPPGVRLLPCATAKGESLLPGFDVSGFSAECGAEAARTQRAVLAVSANRRFAQGCEVLVNALLPFEPLASNPKKGENSMKISRLFRRLIAGFKSKKKGQLHYINGPDTLPAPLNAAQEKELLGRVVEGDARARDALIVHNLRLVVYIARKFENSGVGIEDLISIGTIGLIKAVNTFRPDKNIKLATYASRCIENEILMHMRKISNIRTEMSIDEPLNVDWDGNELLLSDVLGSESDEVNVDLERQDETDLLLRIVNRLEEREHRIMVLRFGLGGGREYTQKEVADLLGISQSYISRLEKRILCQIRQEMEQALL